MHFPLQLQLLLALVELGPGEGVPGGVEGPDVLRDVDLVLGDDALGRPLDLVLEP